MPKSTLALKATVTKRQAAEPVPSDMAEQLEQLRHHQAAENAATTAVEAATAIEPEKPDKNLKQAPHKLQSSFLTGNLGKPVTVFTINGIRLTGKLQQFDQFTLLVQGRDGLDSLVFKHAITTVTLASAANGKQRQSDQGDA